MSLNSFESIVSVCRSNNRIKSWGELTKLAQIPELKALLLVGNLFYDGYSKMEVFLDVLKRSVW